MLTLFISVFTHSVCACVFLFVQSNGIKIGPQHAGASTSGGGTAGSQAPAAGCC